LSNVLWQWVRRNALAPEMAATLMEDAEALTSRVVTSEALWRPALALAIEYSHPVYDTLFIALAQREHTHVVTFDQRLLGRFPDWSMKPA
jgi:predicted nucleic acid-binding protein